MTTGPSSETASAREAGPPPVSWREIVAVLTLVVLCDITLYRSCGPAGHAALMLLAPLLFWLGSPRPRCRASLWVISLMLVVLAAKLLWCGYLLLLPVGVALLVAWTLSLSGQVPHVLETVVFGSQTVSAGCHGLIEQGRFLIRAVPRSTRTHWLNVVLPLVTAVMFSLLFVLAKPDLLATFSTRIAELFDQLRDWLIRRHLWTVTVAVYLLAVTPVDMIVVSYDVRRILAGDPAPCVQISVHPIRSEGVLLLQPLLACRDETIREGIRAMLAQRHEQAEPSALLRQEQGWTSYQIADQLLLDHLRAANDQWAKYSDRAKREEMLKRFHAYAYQWY